LATTRRGVMIYSQPGTQPGTRKEFNQTARSEPSFQAWFKVKQSI
jgi:hypothetical protein